MVDGGAREVSGESKRRARGARGGSGEGFRETNSEDGLRAVLRGARRDTRRKAGLIQRSNSLMSLSRASASLKNMGRGNELGS